MPRPHDTERYELTDTEKRDLIALIEKGKPLPDRYRFLLFEDKREVELVWNGKTREVCTAVDHPRRAVICCYGRERVRYGLLWKPC